MNSYKANQNPCRSRACVAAGAMQSKSQSQVDASATVLQYRLQRKLCFVMVMFRPHLQDRVTESHQRCFTVEGKAVTADPPRLVVPSPVPGELVPAEPDVVSTFGITKS